MLITAALPYHECLLRAKLSGMTTFLASSQPGKKKQHHAYFTEEETEAAEEE